MLRAFCYICKYLCDCCGWYYCLVGILHIEILLFPPVQIHMLWWTMDVIRGVSLAKLTSFLTLFTELSWLQNSMATQLRAFGPRTISMSWKWERYFWHLYIFSHWSVILAPRLDIPCISSHSAPPSMVAVCQSLHDWSFSSGVSSRISLSHRASTRSIYYSFHLSISLVDFSFLVYIYIQAHRAWNFKFVHNR